MRVLHFIKTSDGARWAAEQVTCLVRMGLDVAVVLPSSKGKMIKTWKKSGARLYFEYAELPVRRPFEFFKVKKKILEIVDEYKPDIIHSHFFSQTVLLRMALPRKSCPLIFQVPGPLHLENFIFRYWDILSAREQDRWIASSQAIKSLYLKAGVSQKRVAVSYYGNNLQDYNPGGANLRRIFPSKTIIGNISYFYAPKKYLFQKYGLKGHEFMNKVIQQLSDKYVGVFWGKQFGEDQSYYKKLRSELPKNVIYPGALDPYDVSKAWNTLDICLHMPSSENCGGVVEPLLHEVPVIASEVGGLPEVILNKKTGLIVKRDEKSVLAAINWAMRNKSRMDEMAINGKKLVLKMFDVNRTSSEVFELYQVIEDFESFKAFNPGEFLDETITEKLY